MNNFRIREYGTGSDGNKYFMIDRKDDKGRIVEGIRFTENNLKQIYEFCKKVFGDKTDEQIYREKLKEYTKTDVLEYIEGNKDYEDITKNVNIDEVADTVAEMYADNGDYDCNLSYWQNIDNLIYEVMADNKRRAV